VGVLGLSEPQGDTASRYEAVGEKVADVDHFCNFFEIEEKSSDCHPSETYPGALYWDVSLWINFSEDLR